MRRVTTIQKESRSGQGYLSHENCESPLGTTLLCGLLTVWSFLLWGSGSALPLLAGGLTYLVGTFGLTAGYHVPRNNALDTVDPSGTEAAALWTRYLHGWTRCNHVRGCASVAASALFIVALALG